MVGDFLQGFKEIKLNFNFLNIGAELLWFLIIGMICIVLYKNTKDKLLAGTILCAGFITVGWITTIYSTIIIGGLAIFTVIWALKD